MAIYNILMGDKVLTDISIGGVPVDTVYLGNLVVYQKGSGPEPVDYSNCLRFKATKTGSTIGFYYSTSDLGRNLQYSTDNGKTWTEYTINVGSASTVEITVNSGDTIYFKGDNPSGFSVNPINIIRCKMTGEFEANGDITSLLNSGLGGDVALNGLCYIALFADCTGLTTAPELPSTTLGNKCYNNMFVNCTSLITGPSVLPATTLAESCYDSMFYGCTSLTTAPVLPDATLAESCYEDMFNGCSNLNHIECLVENPNTLYFGNWVYGVSSAGTFVQSSGATWSTGNSGIPVGWDVEDKAEMIECRNCNGTGIYREEGYYDDCPECEGTGMIHIGTDRDEPCPECGGSGKIYNETIEEECPECEGTGKVPANYYDDDETSDDEE